MSQSSKVITPVLIASGVILLVSFGIRGSFGVFQIPIAQDLNWLRAEFSLAIAIQNLAWGFGQPIFAAVAERYGDRLALIIGMLTYCAGLVWSAFAITPEGHQLLNVMIGFGVAGTGFGVIFGMVARSTPDSHRSLALGLVTAIGSGGQIIGPPAVAYLLEAFHWSQVMMILGVVVLATIFCLPFMKTPKPQSAPGDAPMGKAIWSAVKDPSFILIFLGFFSCGYQIGFFTAHFPAFVTELCGPIAVGGVLDSIGVSNTAQLGAWSIGLIGLANIVGTVYCGRLGDRMSKKYMLSTIYGLRVVVATVFILNPITPMSVVIFSILMGLLWLAVVPLTSGLIGQIYGLRYMGTLYGLVFLSHQLGGFTGIWLGGALYDRLGSYDFVWWIGVAVGAFSAVVHLPVDERPVAAQAV